MKQLAILQTETVHDVQALLVQAALIPGAQPLAGAFQVWDLDHCIREDAQGKRVFASVLCALGEAPYDEDCVMEIELMGPVHAVIGYDGEVIRRVCATEVDAA